MIDSGELTKSSLENMKRYRYTKSGILPQKYPAPEKHFIFYQSKHNDAAPSNPASLASVARLMLIVFM
jgi:hypothetical protein